jgi:hypothetical protein
MRAYSVAENRDTVVLNTLARDSDLAVSAVLRGEINDNRAGWEVSSC